MSPAEQIARFVERHPGEWQQADYRAEGASGIQAAAVLPVGGGVEIALVASEGEHVAVWALRSGGHHVGHVGHHASLDAPLLTRISARVADCLQLRGGSADTLPSWLADPVRRHLRTRAGELLTLAGSSPADVVSAAETVDEALCGRPVVEPALSAVLAALQAIGMSCRWIRNPGDTGINPEREALEDARAGLACADDEMTREQYVDLFRDLRRVLGVT